MNNSKNRNIIIPIIEVFTVLLVFKLVSYFLTRLNLNYFMCTVIKEIVLLVSGLFLATILNKRELLKVKNEGFVTGLLVGSSIILLSIVSLCFGIFILWMFDFEIDITSFELILFILGVILVGIGEELLFRGILQNCFHDYFGEISVESVQKAVLFSGAIFGFAHIMNCFTGASLIGATIQAICNIPTGIIFGAIYYRSNRNLWCCILLHSFWDFCIGIQSGVLYGARLESVVSDYNIQNLLFSGLLLMIALFVIRKKKIAPLLSINNIE